jgi:carbon monoxide dehydrogenase subunit G
MEPLNHSFTVPVAIAEAWNVLTNVERIAPCLPGAQLQEIEGETYRGAVKVKVGPIQAQFKGQASFVEKDDANYKVVLKGEGRDTGGKGNASAVITAQLTAIDASSTQVNVNTDLSITGKVAQFGRGALADVSDKLLAQFSENLNNLIAAEPAVAAATPAPEPAPETGQPTVRKIDAPEVAPINLIETAGATIVKRALPVVAGIIVIVLLAIAIF